MTFRHKRTIANHASRARTEAELRGEPLGRCDLTADQWGAILAAWGERCAYCGCGDETLCVEHVEPLSRGGEHTAENTIPACRKCNSAKADLFLLEWTAKRHGLLAYRRPGRHWYDLRVAPKLLDSLAKALKVPARDLILETPDPPKGGRKGGKRNGHH